MSGSSSDGQNSILMIIYCSDFQYFVPFNYFSSFDSAEEAVEVVDRDSEHEDEDKRVRSIPVASVRKCLLHRTSVAKVDKKRARIILKD